MPSGLVMTRFPVPVRDTATKVPLPHATDIHPLATAADREVHVIPSGLVMTRLPAPKSATATKVPFPHATDFQELSAADT